MHCRLMAVSLLLLVALTAAGCNGSRQTDESAYIIIMGVDKAAAAGMIKVTYQLAVPRVVGGNGSGGSGDESKSTTTYTVTASSLAEARNILNTVVARAPLLSHTKVLVIGEELAKSGVGDLLGPLVRYREYRESIVIAVAQGTAEEYIKKNEPKLELLPSTYFETMMLTAGESGYYPQSDLHNFYQRLKSGGGAPYALLLGINPNNGQGKTDGIQERPDRENAYLAGNIPREGTENASEIAGTAIFKADRMVGALTTAETRNIQIVKGEYQSGFFVIDDPLEPRHPVNISLRLGRKPKMKVSMVDGRAVADIDIFMEGEATSISSGIWYESPENRPLLEQQIAAVIQKEILAVIHRTQAMGADVIDLGYHLRPEFKTVQDITGVNWPELYKEADIRVNVSARLRRSGLQGKTSPIAGQE